MPKSRIRASFWAVDRDGSAGISLIFSTWPTGLSPTVCSVRELVPVMVERAKEYQYISAHANDDHARANYTDSLSTRLCHKTLAQWLAVSLRQIITHYATCIYTNSWSGHIGSFFFFLNQQFITRGAMTVRGNYFVVTVHWWADNMEMEMKKEKRKRKRKRKGERNKN